MKNRPLLSADTDQAMHEGTKYNLQTFVVVFPCIPVLKFFMNEITSVRPLNERQAEFVRRFVASGDAHQSALAAGFAPATARNAGTQLLESPSIILAIAQAARIRLARGVTLAMAQLEYLMEKAVSERVRLEAIKTWLDRAGVSAILPEKERNAVEVPLHEMTLDVLRAKVAQMETEIANRATDVTLAAELIG